MAPPGAASQIWAEAAIAPALIIGLRGLPESGSRLMALKASPEGSTSILLAMKSNESVFSASA